MTGASQRELRILFIARAFPPTVGGMENLALHLSTQLGAHAHVETLINRHGKKALPVFLPAALATSVARIRSRRFDAVHLADALLAPLGAALKSVTDLPVTATVCGLDVTYPNRGYQQLVPRALRRLDHAMPISAATQAAMHARTGATPESTVIPLGVNALPRADEQAIAEFKRVARIGEHERVIVTVGRLIERKGAAWFAGTVMPRLPADTVYVVVGQGPMRSHIEAAAWASGTTERVRLLGRLSDRMLAAAYARADVFAMSNVPVAGDMEGFGLVALEASASGVPVVASRLEGITEAVQDRGNGTLVDPLDVMAFSQAITGILEMPRDQARALGEAGARFTLGRYGWHETARRYARVIEDVVATRAGPAHGRDALVRAPASARRE
jgi:phosphatidylinositol alpha-1,6-mannosyltransferase